jgi:hypothetical protein
MSKIIDRAPGSRRAWRRHVTSVCWAAQDAADRKFAEQQQREAAAEAAAEEYMFERYHGDTMSGWADY